MQRSLRYDDNPVSSCVAAAEGRGKGMLLPFSLPRVSVTWVATPCRFVFQLLKQPHIAFAFNMADKKPGHRVYYFYEISRALFLFDAIVRMLMISVIRSSLISVSFTSVLGDESQIQHHFILEFSFLAVMFIKTFSQIRYDVGEGTRISNRREFTIHN